MNDMIIIMMMTFAAVFLLLACIFISIWIYKDCQTRGERAVLWIILVWTTSPLIAIILYLIFRKKELTVCKVCKEPISPDTPYCGQCGSKVEIGDALQYPAPKKHNFLLILSTIFAILMIAFFAAAIVISISENGINFNTGIVYTNIENKWGNTWTKKFGSASDGYTSTNTFTIHEDTEKLYADITCGEGELLLYLIQDDTEIEFDVSSLPAPLSYSLEEFDTGKLTIKIVSNGARNVSMDVRLE